MDVAIVIVNHQRAVIVSGYEGHGAAALGSEARRTGA
jgi:hypothetical protein